ncbi:MAG: RluA family pseudouridine synthase [Mariprofundaceae bacterium]
MKQTADKQRVLHLIIHNDYHGQRLDHVLAALSGLSRSRIQQLLRENHIDGPPHALKAASKVCAGDAYQLEVPSAVPMTLVPEAIDLDILYEDDHLIIINKPAGMVIHPSHGHTGGTLVHALLHHCPGLPGINGVERPGIVHRLDKDTSGSLVVAKSETAHRRLVDMFSTHNIERQYLAWCRGIPAWSQKRIELPIGRHPTHRQKMAVCHHGRAAITDAVVEHRYTHFCRMRLTLHTGRTHQIRVHLSHERLPIIGDTVYGRSFTPGKNIPEPLRGAIRTLRRQALHAEVLGFQHPVTGEALRFLAPLPDDLRALSDALERSYG